MPRRGTTLNPPNPFDPYHFEPDPAVEAQLEEWERVDHKTRLFVDKSRTLIHRVRSPDLGIVYALNPYQGCEHGCIYCYARPYHTYWGWSPGLDFERFIVFKPDAPELVRAFFSKHYPRKYNVHMATATDCYQPVERYLKLTRKILQVFLEWKNPVSIITKNRLITRDIDILKELSSVADVKVTITVTTLNEELRRKLEPRAPTPQIRLKTIETLASSGITTGVMIAPVIPGLNDSEIPEILRLARQHGASFAGYTILRVPPLVESVFLDWLDKNFPDRKNKIVQALKQVHGGRLSNNRWFERLSGGGPVADTIRQLFNTFYRKFFNTTKAHIVKDKKTIVTNATRNRLF